MKQVKLIFLITFLCTLAHHSLLAQHKIVVKGTSFGTESAAILPGADQGQLYLPLLKGKKVALITNQTGVLTQKNNLHLVDFLMENDITIQKIFVPEHGFRGNADAGEVIKNDIDKETGIPLVSLYGSNKKPSPEALMDVDVLIFDFQDVGLRFYTYISTMHYVMEACAEQGKPLIILDRPNPNADYIDGPMLDPKYRSFVGMHEIPVIHGLTMGELAQMINGEGWLKNKVKADITVIPVANWDHSMPYSLPVKPSPNLPNDISIRLYPSLCFFEGTDISVGRGTYFPFQVYGAPDPKYGEFTFTPKSIQGMSKHPPHEDQLCYGTDLREEPLSHQFTLSYLLEMYQKSGKKEKFFNNFFDKLAGTDQLRKDILTGKSAAEIKASWKPALEKYKTMRQKYLLYK